MLKEFKSFAMKGNVIDLAVGVVVGGAFGKIVTSLVNDMIMPIMGVIIGNVDFTNLFITLNGMDYASLSEAQAAGAPTINYGIFINTVLEFLIISFSIFIVLKQLNKFKKKEAPAVTTKKCPHCFTDINIKATRCPNCTSVLD